MAFGTVRIMGDCCEEEGNEWGKEAGGDEAKAGEQLALEPIAMVGEGCCGEKKAMTFRSFCGLNHSV